MSLSLSMPLGATLFSGRLQPVLHPLRWFRRRLLRKPTSTLAMALAGLLGGAIAVNALALQTERHPAPMFTALVEERPVEPAQAAQTPVAPPVAAERKAESQARPVQKAAAESARSAPTNARDQMADLIRTSAVTAAPVTNAEPSQRMQLVQRALNKAGYGPLKEDGAFGSASRQALERFEADRKLAVRGEPVGRTLRELQRASGIVID